MNHRVLVAFGTRPEAIKMAPVLRAIDSIDGLHAVSLATGQHRELLAQALQVFQLVPDLNLDVMTHGQSLSDVTSRVLLGATHVIDEVRPACVLVHGDTTTSTAVALASFYAGVPIGHVEAGLRTFDLTAPFPEEMNRQVTSRLASLNFAPTQRSRENLLNEGIPEEKVWVVGNSVVDALVQTIAHLEAAGPNEIVKLSQKVGFDVSTSQYVLVTAHRRENFDSGLSSLCSAIESLAALHSSTHFLYPVHPNPRVRAIVRNRLRGDNIHVIDPLDYSEFLLLLKGAKIAITDSGGIQEEAPYLGVPVLVVRDETERPEAVESGAALLVGTEKDSIFASANQLLTDTHIYRKMAVPRYVFGDGTAGNQIARILQQALRPMKCPDDSLGVSTDAHLGRA